MIKSFGKEQSSNQRHFDDQNLANTSIGRAVPNFYIWGGQIAQRTAEGGAQSCEAAISPREARNNFLRVLFSDQEALS